MLEYGFRFYSTQEVIKKDNALKDVDVWGGKKNLKSAVWEHARWINKSRKDAENRRLLYVAATRVQDRLIVVGSPEGRDGRNSSKWIEGEGLSFIHDDRKSPPLGHMITNALRA